MVIRIARILGRPNVGGPARTALHLTRRLADRGFETLLIVGASDPEEGDVLEGVTDLPVLRIPEMRRKIGFTDVAARRKLLQALTDFQPHIVHTHAAKAGALGRRAALKLRSSRPKLVHTYHGHSLSGYFPKPVSSVFAFIERRLATQTDRLIAVSERVKRDLVEVHTVAPGNAITVIDNGIDLTPYREPTPEWRAECRARLAPKDPTAFQILVPARLTAIKGQDLLLDALYGLGLAGMRIEAHLVGDGPTRAALEQSAGTMSKGITIRFHGFRSDLPELLAGADLVVLPSRNEGMSLALIESMASGAPILATAVGGTPDLIVAGETGFTCAPSGAALVVALRQALRDSPARERVAATARRIAFDRHSIERVIDMHADLYANVVALEPAARVP